MKNYRNLLLAVPLALLTGCHSDSDSKPKKPTFGPTSITIPHRDIQIPERLHPRQTKPKTDYQFTDAKLEELLETRQAILESMQLSYNGETYANMKFAESLGDKGTLIRLADNNGDSLDLYLLKAGEAGQCRIYHNTTVYSFPCGAETRTTANDTTLIQSVTANTNQPLQLEYNTEVEIEKYFDIIGSTVLTPIEHDNQVTIVTSFAFKDLYQNIVCNDGCDEQFPSTLGVTTYLQLKGVTEQYLGSSMTIKFNNRIGGSGDDDINMYTGLMIHNNNMATVISPIGSVFSGGTDLFVAGSPRTLQHARVNNEDDGKHAIEASQQIGVHSWADDGKTAKEFPYTNENHRKQATYFNTVMGEKGVDFYLFTLDSAPASGEHWVTKAESDQYGLITRIDNIIP